MDTGLSLGRRPLPSHLKVCAAPRMQDVGPWGVEGMGREKPQEWGDPQDMGQEEGLGQGLGRERKCLRDDGRRRGFGEGAGGLRRETGGCNIGVGFMDENIWWFGGGLRGVSSGKSSLCPTVLTNKVCYRIAQAKDLGKKTFQPQVQLQGGFNGS